MHAIRLFALTGALLVVATSVGAEPAEQRDEASRSSRSKGSFQIIPSTPATPTPAPAKPAEAAEETYLGKNEAAWRADAQKYRDAIAGLEERAKKCKKDSFRPSRATGPDAYQEETAEAKACRRVSDDLDMNRRWLEKLEQNAKRAGVPPGWLRD